MKSYVLDSYALIAYFEGEAGAKDVAGIMKDALINKAEPLLCVINWGEIYYITLREGGKEKAEMCKSTIDKYPIKVIDVNKELTLQAASYKVFYKISYADAFAIALAKLQKAELVTGNKEFRALEKEVKIHWLVG